ncbi:MAG: hypothetical protein IJR41_02170, partial [Atopobiaceae bacterium]|nr:hypothetical protein [Atopobiaceae bacterium]
EAGFSMVGLSYRDVHKVNPTDGYIQGYTVDAVESNEDVEFRAVVAHMRAYGLSGSCSSAKLQR